MNLKRSRTRGVGRAASSAGRVQPTDLPGFTRRSTSALRGPGTRSAVAATLSVLAMASGGKVVAADSGGGDPSLLPPPAQRGVSFATDIQPILERACLRCHGAERPRSGFRLDDRELALKGGDLGTAIMPGESDRSPLIHFVARLDEEMAMPPEGAGEPLTAEEVGLLRAWIDQGANWGEEPSGPRFSFVMTPSVQFVTVSGNENRFREHQWMREGWGGGVSEFSMKYDLDPRTRASLDAVALAGREDYRFQVRVERDELGWVRFRYREFTQFMDDTGGYYQPFGIPAPRLDEDLQVTRRHAGFEAGLELPDWPSVRLAYDLHLRQGTESTLHWGSIVGDAGVRNIYPGSKEVDETTHLLTLDLKYDWEGLLLSNQTQFEWHEQNNQKVLNDFPEFDLARRVTDRQDSWRGANVLRVERNVRDWLYLSGGYLYSHLEDSGGLEVERYFPSDPSTPPSVDLSADTISLRRRSHVLNANAMLGPWEALYFHLGLQAEWTRQEGFAIGRDELAGFPRNYNANQDRTATEQHLGLRYTGLAHTILFAETRFQQERYSQFEEGFADDAQDFLRDTDATGDLKDYEVGFTVSPWPVASFTARYRHRDRENDYDHLQDVDVLFSGSGYPAFIRARDTRTDEVEARLVLRPRRWLKATLRYAVASTDFDTVTESWEDVFQNPPATVPGGRIQAGEYDSHGVSAGFVVTPWSRLHVSSTLAWTTSRSRSGVDGGGVVVPYKGDVWSLLNSATFVVDTKTDLTASYYFSCADFSQTNVEEGLPMGIEYTRHGATAGISRRMKHQQLLRLEYGFFTYDEPSLGGAADYTAHGLFASFRVPWR